LWIDASLFSPICTVARFSDFKEVLDRVNNSRYGLQTGIFTRDLKKAFYAFENLHVVRQSAASSASSMIISLGD